VLTPAYFAKMEHSWRLPRCTEGEAMPNLLLQPSGANEYEVIDGDWIVGHIVLLSPAMARTLRMWSLDHAFHEGRDPTLGFAATREAALQAFARSWFGEDKP
jgi:hypothetical protein